MTTWYGHYPLSHPWMPTRKRKHSDSSGVDSTSASDVDVQEQPGSSSVKRRRYDLAGNLSQLSLFEQVRGTTQRPSPSVFQSTMSPSGVSSWLGDASADAPMEADVDTPVIAAACAIVEEPAEKRIPIPEVRMRGTSSYEPEKDRIIITDLESSEDEAETPSETSSGNHAPYSVAPTILSRLKATKFTTFIPKSPSLPGEPDPSRALVLFKPSPWAAKSSHELEDMYRSRDTEKDARDLIVTEVANADTDAMEIE